MGGRMRPVIGITCSRLVGGAWGLYSPGHMMDYTFNEYSRAVLESGGCPVLLPTPQTKDTIKVILDCLSGLILSGGPDVHPRFYREQPLAGLGDLDEELDRTELAWARGAIARDLPVFCICRGIQVLNVSLGGSLYQDISKQVPEAIDHQQKAAKWINTHTIEVEKEGILYGMFRKHSVWVNGKHHQALKDVAPGLEIEARAPDGIVEAVRLRGKRFVLGVQWHPEGTFQNDIHSRKLFQSFVDVCREYLPEKAPSNEA